MSNSGALAGIRSRSPRTRFARSIRSRMRSLPFKTLLFDVDGTLIDSNGAHAESWTQALKEHGVTVEVDHDSPNDRHGWRQDPSCCCARQ